MASAPVLPIPEQRFKCCWNAGLRENAEGAVFQRLCEALGCR